MTNTASRLTAETLDTLHAWLVAWDAPAPLVHLTAAAMSGEDWAIARLDGAAAVSMVLRKFRAQAAGSNEWLTDEWCADAIAALGEIYTTRPDGAIARAAVEV